MKSPTDSNTVRDDTKCSLSTLRAQAGKPLRDIVLEIYKQQWKPNNKSLEFLRNLRCFLPAKPVGEEHPSQDGRGGPAEIWLRPCSPVDDYVALSYPWKPSYGENNTTGGYRIPGSAVDVRDIVLDRTIRFIRYKRGFRGMIPFWIDRISIDQENTPKKEKYMQSMDLVYQKCTFAVGYLWVEVKTQLQVDHLSNLLGGHIIEETVDGQPAPKEGVSKQTWHEVLDLLVQITDDEWWSRAWIFQEDYLAGMKMWLLIRHAPGLDKSRAENELGTLSGELVVKSEQLRRYATLFCLALHARDGRQLVRNACERVIQRAGKYNILHRYERSGQPAMTVRVFTDLSKRDITVPSDLLTIAANVCGYDARILAAKNTSETSLSLAMLTLCMSNGEIISDDEEADRYGNILDFLRNRTMRINAPLADGALTFIKHSRLSVSHLSITGIHTEGILWQLSDPIHPRYLRQRSYSASSNRSQRDLFRDGLSHYQRSRLFDLIRVLTQRNKLHGHLVENLEAYLAVHDRTARGDDWPPGHVMNMMAANVVDAMDTGKYLQVARLVNGSAGKHNSCYSAVFVRDRDEIKRPGQVHAFTSWARTKEQIQKDVKNKTLAKYVSIEVSLDENEKRQVRTLRSRGWTNGLCFFGGEIKSSFVLAWPKSLCK